MKNAYYWLFNADLLRKDRPRKIGGNRFFMGTYQRFIEFKKRRGGDSICPVFVSL
jgi:hypothetical protein